MKPKDILNPAPFLLISFLMTACAGPTQGPIMLDKTRLQCAQIGAKLRWCVEGSYQPTYVTDHTYRHAEQVVDLPGNGNDIWVEEHNEYFGPSGPISFFPKKLKGTWNEDEGVFYPDSENADITFDQNKEIPEP